MATQQGNAYSVWIVLYALAGVAVLVGWAFLAQAQRLSAVLFVAAVIAAAAATVLCTREQRHG